MKTKRIKLLSLFACSIFMMVISSWAQASLIGQEVFGSLSVQKLGLFPFHVATRTPSFTIQAGSAVDYEENDLFPFSGNPYGFSIDFLTDLESVSSTEVVTPVKLTVTRSSGSIDFPSIDLSLFMGGVFDLLVTEISGASSGDLLLDYGIGGIDFTLVEGLPGDSSNEIVIGFDLFTELPPPPPSSVPVPAAVWLFGSGLIGLIGIARRKK